jgi:hypothetical protein
MAGDLRKDPLLRRVPKQVRWFANRGPQVVPNLESSGPRASWLHLGP